MCRFDKLFIWIFCLPSHLQTRPAVCGLKKHGLCECRRFSLIHWRWFQPWKLNINFTADCLGFANSKGFATRINQKSELEINFQQKKGRFFTVIRPLRYSLWDRFHNGLDNIWYRLERICHRLYKVRNRLSVYGLKLSLCECDTVR